MPDSIATQAAVLQRGQACRDGGSRSRGFLTLACGQRRYLDFAVDLALSLKERNADPVALVLGEELRLAAAPELLRVFDTILPLPPGFSGTAAKFSAYASSPFERTMFIDADCLAIAGFAAEWERLRPFGFAVQGSYLTEQDDKLHHGYSTAALMRQFGLTRYLRSNSGLVYFEKARGAAVAAAALETISRWRGSQLGTDEVPLGLVADAMDVARIPRPLPMPWWPHVVAPGDDRFRVVHMIGPVRPETMSWLFGDVVRRRRAARLPPYDSVACWVAKSLGRYRRVAGTIGPRPL